MESRSLITPAPIFFALVFFTQFISDLYAELDVEIPFSFEQMARFAIVWTIWWWLRDDSRRSGKTLIMDLGMFLLIAWPLMLPFHLFKSRGLTAFIPILAFILTALCGRAAAVVISIFSS